MSGLIRLYPAAWRQRYEAEFLALLEARPPTIRDQFDIIRGALDARVHPQVRHPEEPDPVAAKDGPDDTVIVRRLGYGAIAGGVVWLVTWALATIAAPVVYDGYGPHRDGSGALVVLLLSTFLLVGGLIGHLIVLPTTRRTARASAVAAIPLILLWSFGPWVVWFGLLALLALVAFAIASIGTPHWSTAATAGVLLGGLGMVGLGLVTLGLVNLGADVPYEFLFVITGTAAPMWLAIGGPLTRVRPAVAGV
ncbi:MAG: hypothetical protein ACJ767_11075 [Chloroflexota bacterium]